MGNQFGKLEIKLNAIGRLDNYAKLLPTPQEPGRKASQMRELSGSCILAYVKKRFLSISTSFLAPSFS
jgi:hypothetical protein